MASEILGDHFDIHGGGADLQFPHHENEIAQSEGAQMCDGGSRGQYVNYWMHNGFVRVDNEKMSKSLGNFFTIREVLKKYDAEVVRFFILRAHYRSPLNYSDQHLDDAKGALTRLYTALKSLTPPGLPLSGEERSSPNATVTSPDKGRPGGVAVDWSTPHAARFKAAMDDDFNTPEAVAVLFDLASEVNRNQSDEAANQLKSLAGVLGLLQRSTQDFLQSTPLVAKISAVEAGDIVNLQGAVTHTSESIQQRIDARIAAKKAKNFAEADRIRKELLEAGIVLEDTAQGTSWRRA
jgi:cysteinyl-tRNA synthetase